MSAADERLKAIAREIRGAAIACLGVARVLASSGDADTLRDKLDSEIFRILKRSSSSVEPLMVRGKMQLNELPPLPCLHEQGGDYRPHYRAGDVHAREAVRERREEMFLAALLAAARQAEAALDAYVRGCAAESPVTCCMGQYRVEGMDKCDQSTALAALREVLK